MLSGTLAVKAEATQEHSFLMITAIGHVRVESRIRYNQVCVRKGLTILLPENLDTCRTCIYLVIGTSTDPRKVNGNSNKTVTAPTEVRP